MFEQQVYEGFSHVVFATQANHGSTLLKTYLDSCPESSLDSQELSSHKQAVQAQIDCLSSFSYCPSIVINHTDERLATSLTKRQTRPQPSPNCLILILVHISTSIEID
ncbi:hypothetical protein QCA50_008671 [Cerrena zonata]|uniref:Uncharacterized protein n=1 Tax=Cerrena zonata TaxID=2478898 RepID=A0AAW0GH42_9APHY